MCSKIRISASGRNRNYRRSRGKRRVNGHTTEDNLMERKPSSFQPPRTPIGKASPGALNNTEGPTMAGHVIAEAVKRAG